MITAITGLPGSGKSYYATERIYTALSQKKQVITNIESINIRRVAWDIEKRHGIPKEDTLKRFLVINLAAMDDPYRLPVRNSEIWLDEVMVRWHSRKWAKFPETLMTFLSQHRKYRCDIYYISQSFERVDATLRDLTQTEIRCRNLSHFKKWWFKLPHWLYLRHSEAASGLKMFTELIIPQQRFYGYYDSWALFYVGNDPGPVVDLATRRSVEGG
jgi:zona occludens toxin (predicted ATPase)